MFKEDFFHFHTGIMTRTNSQHHILSLAVRASKLKTSRTKWAEWRATRVYLAALDQLLVSRLVLVGGGSVLSCSNGLSGCSCCLLCCILLTNTYISSKRFTANLWKTDFS